MRNAVALCRSYMHSLHLGAETSPGPGCLAVRQDAAPLVYDVNHVQVPGDADPNEVLRFADDQFAERQFRKIFTQPSTAPEVVAALALAGFVPDLTLQLLLRGELRGPPPPEIEIHPVQSEADWEELDRLARANHVEVDQVNDTTIFSEDVTRQIQLVRRRAAEQVHFFLARIDAKAVAFFSSWPGIEGLGMVEDLFTLPSYRHRGVARALIHHCVADARARGGDAVLIGADPADSPKHYYAELGFAPTCLTTGWLKKLT